MLSKHGSDTFFKHLLKQTSRGWKIDSVPDGFKGPVGGFRGSIGRKWNK